MKKKEYISPVLKFVTFAVPSSYLTITSPYYGQLGAPGGLIEEEEIEGW